MSDISPTPHTSTSQHALLNFVSIVVSLVANFGISVIVARALGPVLLGRYSFVVFAAGLIATVFSAGLPSTITKYLAECLGNNRLELAAWIKNFFFKFTSGAAVVTVFFVVIIFTWLNGRFFHGEYSGLLVYASLYAGLTVVTSYYRAIAGGFQDFGFLLRLNIIISTATAAGTVLIIIFSPGIVGLLLVGVLTLALSTSLYAVHYQRRRLPTSVTISPGFRREVFHYLWPVALITIIDLVVWQFSEIIFLGIFRSPQEVSFYTIPFNIAALTMSTFPGAIIGVLLPALSKRFNQTQNHEVQGIYRMSMKFVTYLVVPIFSGALVMAAIIIRVFYGAVYAPAANIFPALIFSAGLGQVAAVAASLLYSHKRQLTILRFMTVVGLTNIVLDVILIPRFGIYGAATANVVAQVLASVMTLLTARMTLKTEIDRKILVVPIIAGITMAGLVWLVIWLVPNIFGLAASLIVGPIIYWYLLRWLKAFNQEDVFALQTIGDYFPAPVRRHYLKFINIRTS